MSINKMQKIKSIQRSLWKPLLVGAGLLLSLTSAQAQIAGPGPFTIDAPVDSSGHQWVKDGVDIAGETGTSYDAATPGMYWVQFTDDSADIVCTGLSNDTYTVVVQDGDPEKTRFAVPRNRGPYQWYKDGVAIAGKTNRALNVESIADSVGVYHATYNNAGCEQTTELFTLNVLLAVCGNGIVENGEACDDGNAVDDDACSNICEIVNNPPVAVDDAGSTTVDTPVVIDAIANDSDTDGTIDITEVEGKAIVNNGAAVVLDDGTSVKLVNGELEITPVAGSTVDITFPYTIEDDDGAQATANVDVTIAPVAVDDDTTTTVDTPVTINPLTNDNLAPGTATITEVDGQAITDGGAAITLGDGTTVALVSGELVVTPPAGSTADITFPYTVVDSENGTASANVNVTMPPVAVDDAVTTPVNTPVTIGVLNNDNLASGAATITEVDGQAISVGNPVTLADGSTVALVGGELVVTPPQDSTTAISFSYTVVDSENGTATADVVVTLDNTANIVKLKVFLAGALVGGTDELMRDDLRDQGKIPETEPYTDLASGALEGSFAGGSPQFDHVIGGGEVTSAAVLAVTGTEAIVDWVFVELRDSTDSSVVLETQSALVQRDGDVVSASDGVSPITMTSAAGPYFVSVRHRNHLGVMTATAITTGATMSTIDFTEASTPTYVKSSGLAVDNNPQLVVGESLIAPGGVSVLGEHASLAGRTALFLGNSNVDNKVNYAGQSADTGECGNQVQTYPGNTNNDFTITIDAYALCDIDMNGTAKYGGGGLDDIFWIFSQNSYAPTNVNSSGNKEYFAAYVILEHLPD